MRKQNAEFKTAFTSEANEKLKNTDSFGFVELDDFACYVIADGIDDNLDAASAKLAVDTIISAFTAAPSMRKGTMKRCLRAANRALIESKSKMKLKASVTMVVTNYVKFRYGQAGNTRLRLYRDGFLQAQSTDNSLSMDMVAKEKLEPDKLAQHEERNNLYCFLGQESGFSPFISKKIKLSNSDAIALLTRGIWQHIDDGELKDAFADATDDPQPTTDSIEDLLLSKQPKGLEKYTFAAIFVNKVFIDPTRARKIKKAIMIAIPILLVAVVLTVVLLILHHNRVKNTETMNQGYYDAIEYLQADNYIRAQERAKEALKLAEKLRDKKMQAELGNYLKLIESVIAGDDALNDLKYEDAQRNYLNARERARYADNLGMDYIDDKLELTSQYMGIYDMISLGDTLALNLQYDKAEDAYLEAKALSAKVYFDRGRDDAMAALEKLYTDMEAETAAGNEAAQAKAEDQTAATSVLAEGDAAFAKGDYESAQVYYTTALQKYTELEDETQAKAIRLKLDTTEQKIGSQKELISEAEGYMAQAQSSYEEKDYVTAQKYYLLAKDIYVSLKNDDKVAEIGRKMELIDMGITAEEQARREAEAAKEAAEKETEATPSPDLEAGGQNAGAAGSPAPEATPQLPSESPAPSSSQAPSDNAVG